MISELKRVIDQVSRERALTGMFSSRLWKRL